MTIIDKIINIIFDKSKSIGVRSGIFFISLIVLLTADYLVNFTYDIHVTYKLETLEKISQLKKEYIKDTTYNSKLNELEKEYKERKHYYGYLNQFMNFSTSFIKSDNKVITKSQIKKTKTITNNPIRSKFWMFVSSNFIFIILTLFIFITPIFSKELNTKDSLLGLFIVLILVVCIMLFANWTAYFIPILFNNPFWNYILNFIIHLTIITLISITTVLIKRRKSNS